MASPNASDVYIAYWHPGATNGLKIARSFDGGATWPVKKLIDQGNLRGKYVSIASPDSNLVFISYCDCSSAGDLRSVRSVGKKLFNY